MDKALEWTGRRVAADGVVERSFPRSSSTAWRRTGGRRWRPSGWRASWTPPASFHVQWHDEIFPSEGQLALFDLLGSRDKHWIGYAGRHGETRPTAVTLWRDFVVRHLAHRA